MMKSKLSSYRKKRKFKETPEPKGKILARAKQRSSLTFVIQLHKASHLHYDFRLKIGNVLKSWAIPKGPSMDPKDKRLALPTEDHPLEYAKFEGVIPKGHYGAGHVIVWDKGKYKNFTLDRKDTRSTKINQTVETSKKTKFLDLEKAYENGHIIIELKGQKLKGKFVLQQFRLKETSKKNAWVLIKMNDDYANTKQSIIKTRPESVLSGLTLTEFIRSQN